MNSKPRLLNADPDAETPLNVFSSLYVPADEQFPLVKGNNFLGSAVRAFVHAVLPFVKQFLRLDYNYKSFPDVDSLYSSSTLEDLRKKAQKLKAQQQQQQHQSRNKKGYRGLTTPQGVIDGGSIPLLKFPVPEIIQGIRNTHDWIDETIFDALRDQKSDDDDDDDDDEMLCDRIRFDFDLIHRCDS
jgi:hypothetical protein